MPELPEVETVRKNLTNELLDDKIENIEIYFSKMLQNTTPKAFVDLVSNRVIEHIGRIGKYLIIYLGSLQEDTKKVLIIHLRMTGRLLVINDNTKVDKHLRCRFFLKSGRYLDFCDQRKFATMALVNKGEEFKWKGIALLGPEPISDDFELTTFYKGLKKSKKSIKAILLDQKLVCGLGNIYSDEALFRAGIHPQKAGEEISQQEAKQLFSSIKKVISEGIKERGTTFSDYRDSYGNKGGFQELLQVYGRARELCFICKNPLEKIRVANRGTTICPKCQK
ncbi:bifunctional DNA-formamidopyrimidine glycosylase/DNA-(apurinic or apyrimidinic site) lyase [Natranaerobius trueperi]|uniref:Formamidopyrimidine-DNA glycosylase n=1 Tax=Natranaerobius trueperi TaxID=759412 RepID=A0A226BWA1_9FIRM|nr:bifunctional DNA-formamidopyrimidine glycosylase/DNA-(apurinic or apyrimidinic site) lyase [Natranaerobius trueperi]OWZ83318.1 DNA-formamidopyrimidine glycosylase [Natranaerobius trueperi]